MKSLIAAAAIAVSIAAGAALAQTPTATETAAPAPAAPPTALEIPPPPVAAPPAAPTPAAKGHIIFFRPAQLSGAVYTYHVVETEQDGKHPRGLPILGDLPNGGAFAIDVEPGIHNYNLQGKMAVNKAEDRLRMEVEPGETYYVEQAVRMGVLTGGFRLVPADEARFKRSKARLHDAKR